MKIKREAGKSGLTVADMQSLMNKMNTSNGQIQ